MCLAVTYLTCASLQIFNLVTGSRRERRRDAPVPWDVKVGAFNVKPRGRSALQQDSIMNTSGHWFQLKRALTNTSCKINSRVHEACHYRCVVQCWFNALIVLKPELYYTNQSFYLSVEFILMEAHFFYLTCLHNNAVSFVVLSTAFFVCLWYLAGFSQILFSNFVYLSKDLKVLHK